MIIFHHSSGKEKRGVGNCRNMKNSRFALLNWDPNQAYQKIFSNLLRSMQLCCTELNPNELMKHTGRSLTKTRDTTKSSIYPYCLFAKVFLGSIIKEQTLLLIFGKMLLILKLSFHH